MLPFSFWQPAGEQRAQSKGKKHFHSPGPRADPLGEAPLLSHGAFNTGRATALHCGVGDWGKKAIHLDWGWRGKHSPVPLLLSLPLLHCPLPAAPRLAGLTPAAGGFLGLCLCANADTFQQAATQTQTSKGWHVCFLKQLSRFYWAIKYSDEDIKTKLWWT